MVNFGVRLRDNMFAEWKHEYLDYKRLKRMLAKQRQLDAELGSAASAALALDVDASTSESEEPSSSSLLRSLVARRRRKQAGGAKADTAELLVAPVAFEEALEVEADKVERAYAAHVAHFAEQLALLRAQYRADAPLATQESLKNALVELHRLLNLLTNFALLNYTGFVKILKKHDKLFPSLPPLRRQHGARLQGLAFATARPSRALLREVEELFAARFCDGNRAVALATLLTKREDVVNFAHMYIGVKVGACLILLVWVGWDSLVVPTFRSERERHLLDLAATRAYPVYRGVGCLLLLHWLVGVSLFVWRKARINYRYIFELDPRTTQQYTQVFSDATNMTIVFLANVLLYYKVVNGYFPEALLHRGYYPLLLCAYTFYFYVVRAWGQQRGLLRTVLEIVCSPFYAVTFFHTFVGNYLTSVVKVSQDLCWSVCFFATKEFLEKDAAPGEFSDPEAGCSHNFYYANVVVPLLCAFPLWWRFLQCLRRIYDSKTWWPSLPNAFKYALAQVVALFGLFHPFYAASSDQHDDTDAFRVTWVVLFTLGSLYTWVWDVTMDWGLGQPETKLRGYRQMFSRKWIYTAAVVADFFLCFTWSLSISARRKNDEFLLYVQPFTMVAELFRRTIWSFFTLENEHLRNTFGFRRADFIPLHYDSAVDTESESGEKPEAPQPPPQQVGALAVLVNVSLLALAVVAMSAAAIALET
ncbi:hypothetical protein PybrP1_011226 [[Pythium] brassicae (nom. inval.)]|nr:hypothetical protein PybrP1_011226 [[Pythium] brassicae (nom. inval.)]